MRYSQAEIEWVKTNFPNFDCFTFAKEYNKTFERQRTWRGLDSLGKWLGLKKKTVNSFTHEETNWLIENYGANEPNEITFKKFTDLFGDNHTFCAFIGKIKQLHLKKQKKVTMLQYQYLQSHNEIPPNCYLVECEGEIIDIPKDIYNCLNARGYLNKGEFTKTMVEIYRAKKDIENISGKKLFAYHPTKEHIAKMNSVPKTYHKKFEGEKLKEMIELYKKGMGCRKLARKYGCSHHCISMTLKRNQFQIRRFKNGV